MISGSFESNSRLSLIFSICIAAATYWILLSFGIGNNPYRHAIYVLMAAFSIVAGSFIDVIFRPAVQPIYIVSLLYLSAFYIGPGLLHLNEKHFPFYNLYYKTSTALDAALVVLVFTISMVAVNSMTVPIRETIPQRIDRLRFPAVFIILTLMVILSATVVGFDYLTVRRGDMEILFEDPSPLQIMLAAIARMGSFVLFSLSISVAKERFTAFSAFGLLISGALFFIINNPIALARFALGAYVIILFFAHVKQSRKTKALFIVSMITAQLTIFPILSEWSRGNKNTELSLPNPVEYLSTHGDFDGFQSTMNVVEWVNGGGMQGGRQLLSAIFFFVPREYLSWKSKGTGGEAAAYVGYKFINISSPLPSEFFADFGFIGVLIMSPFVAMILRSLDIRYNVYALSGANFRLLTCSVVAGYAMIIFRGTLAGVIGPFALSLAMSILSVWFLGTQAAKLRTDKKNE